MILNGKSNVVITGGTGRLGKQLLKVLEHSGYAGEVFAPTREELNLVYSFNEQMKYFANNVDDFRCLIHAAALTGIPPCEENPREAYMTNVMATANLYKVCQYYDAYMVYISTPCIFSGEGDYDEEIGGYIETDTPRPSSHYGFTKAAGEAAISTLPNSIVVRGNFVGNEPWEYEKAFTDRYGTYLLASDFAFGIVNLLANMRSTRGIIHIPGKERLSMYELACRVNEIYDEDPPGKLTLDEYDGNGSLTKDMSLESMVHPGLDLGMSLEIIGE